jgi:hypothetical protein
VAARADAFGIGSALYRPGMSRDDLEQKAAAFVAAIRQVRQNRAVRYS